MAKWCTLILTGQGQWTICVVRYAAYHQRLISPFEVQDFLTINQSLYGWRRNANNRVEEEEIDDDHQIRNDSGCGVVLVTALLHREFRGLFVDNFNALNRQGRASLPKRLPVAPRNVPT
jgi:hypothetical protein